MMNQEVVISADLSGYTRPLQQAYEESSRFNQLLGSMDESLNKLQQRSQRRWQILEASTIAGITTATAAAAKLEEHMSQLEGRAVVTGQRFSQATQAVSGLRREFGMAAESAAQLIAAMSTMGAAPGQQQDLAKSYVRLSAVTGESITGLAAGQNQFMRTMNYGRIPSNMDNYSSMTAGLALNQGVSATGMLETANRIAPMAQNLGMNQRDIMGFSAAFEKAGQGGIGVSTAFNRILSDINFSRQWGGDDAKKYAAYLGMDEAKFNETPMTEIMTKLFTQLGSGSQRDVKFLDRMGLDGVRTQNVLAAMNSSGALPGAINQAYSSYSDKETFQEGAEAALRGLNDESRKTAEMFKEVAESIGGLFIPALTAGAEAFNATIGTVVKGFTDMLNGIPEPVRKLGGAAASGMGSVGGVLAAALPYAGTAMLAGGLLRNSATMGMRHGWNPNMAQSANLAMLVSGQGTPIQQGMFRGGQMAGRGIGQMRSGAAGLWATMGRGGAWGMNMIGDQYRMAMEPITHPGSHLVNARDRSPLRGGMGLAGDRVRWAMYGGALASQGGGGAWDEHRRTQAQALQQRYGLGGPGPVFGETREDRRSRRGQSRTFRGAAARNIVRGAGTTLRGTAALAGQGVMAGGRLLSGLGLNPAMLGITGLAVGGSMLYGHMRDRKEEMRGFSSESQGTALSNDYLKALGQATEAINTFGDALRNNTPGDTGARDMVQATSVTDADIERASGRKSRIDTDLLPELEALDRTDEREVRGYAEAAMMGVRTPQGAALLRDNMLAIGIDPKLTEDTLKDVWAKINEEGGGGIPSDAIRLIASEDEGLSDKGRATWQQFVGRVQERGGAGAVGDAASAVLEEILQDEELTGRDKEKIFRTLLSESGYKSDTILGVDELDFYTKGLINPAKEGFEAFKPAPGQSAYTREKMLELLNEEMASQGTRWDFGQTGDFKNWMAAPPVADQQMDLRTAFEGYEGTKNPFVDSLLKGGAFSERFMSVANSPGSTADNWLMSQEMVARASNAYMPQGVSYSDGSGTDQISALREVQAEMNRFAAAMDQANPEIAALARAAGEAAGRLASIQVNNLGQNNLMFTPLAAMRSFDSAADNFRNNRSSSTYTDLMSEQEGLDSQIGQIDSFVRGAADQIRGMEISEKFQERGLERSQERSRELFDRQMGRQSSDRQRDLGWQQTDYDRQLKYRDEDYQRSRKYQEQDFQQGRAYAEEDFARSRMHEEEDFQKYRARAEDNFELQRFRTMRSWNRSRSREEENFNRSRMREEEDFNHRVEQMAKQQARNITDIYSRVMVERTWSADNLIQNLADQQRRMDEQIANLEKARALGLSTEAIETMGLGDFQKAQQLQRLVDQMSMGEVDIQTFNQAVAQRIDTSKTLMTDESNSSWTEQMYQRERSLAHQLEDYRRNRDQAASDFRESLADQVDDFARSIREQDEDRESGLQRALESYEIGMLRQFDAYVKANKRSLKEFNEQGLRMNESHEISLARSEELYRQSIERSSDDFEEGLKYQDDMMKIQFAESREAMSDHLEIVTMTTQEAFNTVGENISGMAKFQLGIMNGYYDGMMTRTEQIRDLVNTAFSDLNIPVEIGMGDFKIAEKNNASPQTPLKPGYVPESIGSQLPYKDGIGGPEGSSSIAHAGLLGGGSYSGGSGQGAKPAEGSITQGYHGDHPGVDIAGSMGDPIRSAQDGKVIFVGDGGAYGMFTKIAHGGGAESWYGHQSLQNVSVGDEVKAGQPIGRVGSTGHSTGPHLHFEMRYNGEAVDPSGYTSGDHDTGHIGGPGLEAALKKANLKKAGDNWDEALSKTPFKGAVKKGLIGRYWESRIRKAYESTYGPEIYGDLGASTGTATGDIVNINGKMMGRGTYQLLKAAEGLLGSKMSVTQGAFRPRTSYSGSTHMGDGVLDLLPATENVMNALRRVGAAAWLRLPHEGNWGSHVHSVFPVSGLSQAAYNQYQNYLKGMNGLGKKDRYPYVAPDPQFRSGSATTQTISSPVLGAGRVNVRPVPGKHSGWNGGKYKSGRTHGGLDFPSPAGTPIKAWRAGTVTIAQDLRDSYGKNIQIAHADGYATRYAHMSRRLVDRGAKVQGGQVVGLVGSTGNSTGNHLHFEVMLNGKKINPSGFLGGGYAGGTQNSAGGIKEVGEHGIELVVGRGLRKFLGGEQVLNPMQTRNAFNKGLGGTTPSPSAATVIERMIQDHSMKVENVTVMAANTDDIHRSLEAKRRMTALSGG